MRYNLILVVLIVSCTQNGIEEHTEQTHKSCVGRCLNEHFGDYLSKFELLVDVLGSDGLLTNTKDGFSETIQHIYSPEIGQFELNDSQTKTLSFINNSGDLALLLSCCAEYTKDNELSLNQSLFFEELDQSRYRGAIDVGKIAVLIDQMSEEEFEANAVRETALIFISHELFRNHYLVDL